jgi:hypothetical protein
MRRKFSALYKKVSPYRNSIFNRMNNFNEIGPVNGKSQLGMPQIR